MPQSLAEAFAGLPDPRLDRGKKHSLADMELGRLVRRHWGNENDLHWVLDVAFREDPNKTSAGHAGANLGLVRRAAALI